VTFAIRTLGLALCALPVSVLDPVEATIEVVIKVGK